MAINNIRAVNSNAADITDNCMMSVSDLGEIKNDIQVIHTLGLSHIIATDLNTMISVVGEINDNQEELEKSWTNIRNMSRMMIWIHIIH